MSNVKSMRAQAKQFNELARMLEMAQDPQKFMQKQLRKKVSGAKRKMKNQIMKSIFNV